MGLVLRTSFPANLKEPMVCYARHYVFAEDTRTSYYAIFSSHLIYASQIWGQVTNSFNQKIFKLQNRALRIISFSDFHANATPIYKDMKILKLEDFISLQNCLFVHDFLNKKLPRCFETYFLTLKDIHHIRTRRSNWGCLFIPSVSTSKYGLNSISIQSILSWNYLCTALKCDLSTLSRSVTKSKVTEHFLQSYN